MESVMGVPRDACVDWSEDRIEKLKKCFEAGMSAGAIAKEFGDGFSRNRICGKLHRLGLTRSGVTSDNPGVLKEKKPRKKKNRIVAAPNIVPALPSEPAEAEAMEFSVTACRQIPLVELTENNCHWPIGVPGEADFSFCGNAAQKGSPYCAGHCRLSYLSHRPLTKRVRAA